MMKTQEATTTSEATKKTTAKGTKPAKAKPAPKSAKASRKAKPGRTAKTKDAARPGSKKDIVLKLLRREGGATLAELAKATGWQNHSIRGFLSAQVGKKMGLKLESEKVDGERRYRLPS
jgi:hypothetical protein